jgi:hypothetical protein
MVGVQPLVQPALFNQRPRLARKKPARGFSRKISNAPAPRLVPTGAGDLIGFAPAEVEALNGYAKSPATRLLEFGFFPARVIGRGLHLGKQKLVAGALAIVLREWRPDDTNFS